MERHNGLTGRWRVENKAGPYGPTLIRRRPEEEEFESDPGPKTPAQRRELRLALALVGALAAAPTITSHNDTLKHWSDETHYSEAEPPVAQTGEVESADLDSLGDNSAENQSRDESVIPESGASESAEREPTENLYEARVSGYEALFRLPHDAVQVVDEANRPVGDPISFVDDSLGLEPGAQGPVNEAGIATEGITSTWLAAAREAVAAEHPEAKVATQLHANELFRRLYADERFTELKQLIDAEQVQSLEDIVAYFIDQPIVDTNGTEVAMNRYEYAVSTVSFRDEELVIPVADGEVARRRAIPDYVQAFWRETLPGLLAHESRFRDDLESSAEAKGAAQIIPTEWKRVTGESAVDTNYTRQIALWGEIMSDHFNSMYERISEPILAVLRTRFADTEEFERELIARLALLAYNTGPTKAAKAVETYVTLTPEADIPMGKEAFLAIIDFAAEANRETLGEEFAELDNFGSEARAYVPKAEAAARSLRERYRDV